MKKLSKIVSLLLITSLIAGCAAKEPQISSDDTSINLEETLQEPVVEEDVSEFWIRYIDVAQAEAAFVCSDGQYMLIDGGNPSDSNKIYSILKSEEVENLDIVIASHPHQDHVGGLSAAYQDAVIERILSPVTFYDGDAFYDLIKYVKLYGGSLEVPKIGDTYKLGAATIEILGLNADDKINNSSIICKITYGDTSFVFTGDAEYEAEIAAVESGMDLSADVLKVSHHGSDTSSSYRFIREVMPKAAIISVGAENEYGHPTETTLSRLSDAECEIYRTDLHGDITVHSDGTNIRIETEKEASYEEIMTPGEAINGAISDAEGVDSSEIEANYVCNEGSRKFHIPTCESVEKMHEKNKRYYEGTREELISMKYEPCGACKP